MSKEYHTVPTVVEDEDESDSGTESLAVDKLDERSPQKKVSNFYAFWNICNSIQGVAILAMPETVKYGGVFTVLCMTVVAILSSYTAKILVSCLYTETTSGKRIRQHKSYADVGEAFWPGKGRILVLVVQFLELLFMATLYPIICGEVVFMLSPVVSRKLWILIFGLAMIPNIFLKSLFHVSWISLFTVVSAFLVFGTVAGYSFSCALHWQSEDLLVFQPEKFPIAVGIIVASYSSQMYLAVLEGDMETPERFSTVTNYAYLAMTVMKIGIGVAGYLTFQNLTAEIITNNLPSQLRLAVNVLIVLLAFSSYSLPMFTVFKMLENADIPYIRPCIPVDNKCSILSSGLRLSLVIVTIILAVFVPYFSLLLAFIGSLTGALIEYIFPCVFHLCLKWDSLRWYDITFDILIVIFSSVLGVVGLFVTGKDLLVAYGAF